MTTPNAPSIPVSNFGRDHWSTFAYLVTRLGSSSQGLCVPVREKMRCNARLHPHFAHLGTRIGGPYPTRLGDGTDLQAHDDWSCLDDMEAGGLIRNEGTGLHRAYRLLPAGLAAHAALTSHCAAGNNRSTFRYSESV